MEIIRSIQNRILEDIDSGKIILIFGARQVGKTTLINRLLDELGLNTLRINGEEKIYNDLFSNRSLKDMTDFIGNNDLLFIDEAQMIGDIGTNIKILHDAKPNLKIILTGSSSFDLASKTKEPLTGRTITYQLHPISLIELAKNITRFELKQNIANYLLYGMYPEVLTHSDVNQKIRHLKKLSASYLYKDILQLSNIKHADVLHKLLRLLALQIGNLVSIKELSNNLNISFDTVASYIDILEKAFVIIKLEGYSTNKRKEISKMDKIYFVDLGIRNALLNDFRSIDFRNDIGGLWENFLIMERTKKLDYKFDYANQYFWRKYTGAEVDYVEEKDAQIDGYEFKWGKIRSKSKHSLLKDYPSASYQMISRDNFLDFIISD